MRKDTRNVVRNDAGFFGRRACARHSSRYMCSSCEVSDRRADVKRKEVGMKNKKIVLVFAMAMFVTSVFAQQAEHVFKGSVYGGSGAQTSYEVKFVAGRHANVTLSPLMGRLNLYVYDPKGYLVAKDDSPYGQFRSCRFLPSKTGKYTIVIESFERYNRGELFFVLQTY